MRSRLPLLALALMSLAGCAATSGTMISGKTGSADPETVAGDYLQGRFAASQQRFGDASDAFSRAIAETGDAGVKQSAFRYALVAGDFTRARAYAEEILSAPPVVEEGGHDQVQLAGFLDDDLPRLTLIADAFRGQNYIAAQAALKDPFASGLGTAMGDLLEAWAIYPDSGLEAATAKLAETQESNFAGFTPFHLALMFDLEDRTEGAEVAYAQALRAPGADMAVRAYAGFVERNKSKEEAIDLFQKLSEDRGYLRRVGRLGLSRLGEPLAGETAEFRRVAAKAPLRMVSSAEEGAALVFLNFAWTAYERAMTQRAAALEAGFGEIPLNLEVPLTLAQLAVAIDPDLDGGHYIIGSIATYYERYDDAARAQGRVKPVSWLYNYAAIAQAEAYVAMDRRNEGINLIKDYLKQDALAPDVTLELANLLAQEGRIDEAYKAGSEAIAIAEQLSSEENRGSNLWRYYFARGAITAEVGDWARAEPDLRQSLELSPDEPGLLNYLGYSYVERGENIDEAFGMIERALEARPTSGAITDSLGWAYYQRGDYKTAVEYLERAVQLEPGDDVITDHLGDAYWQAGRKSEARYEWRRVLEIEGLGEELKQRVEAKLNGEPPAPGSLADMADSEQGQAMPLAEIQSLAKINLALHVGGVRPDGYHPVDTLCVFAAAGDVLSIEEEADEFSLVIDGEEGTDLSLSADNLVLRAARAFAAAAEIRPARFRLTKNVPVASGIGGGTSNGAAALALLNQRAKVPLSVAGLMALAQRLGADGPVCLAPYITSADSYWARGIGFEVTNGPSLPPLHIVLANPRQAVPTGAVFRAFDKAAAPSPFDLPETARLAAVGEVSSFLSGTRNDLATPARVICPAIAVLEEEMSAQPGCLGARMSGSGATVFGLFSSASAATRAARRFVAEGHWAVSSPLFRKGTS